MRTAVRLILGAVLCPGLVTGCGRRVSEDPPNTIRIACTITDKQDTGRRVYCGKACSAPIYVYTYRCPEHGTVEGQ